MSGFAWGWTWRPIRWPTAAPRVTAPVAHRQFAEVEGVEDQLDAAPDQSRVDLVGVGVQRDGRGLGYGAPLGPQERLMQLGGCWQRRRFGGGEPGRRGLLGFRMHALVVDGLDPAGEQLVELAQPGDLGQRVPGR